MKLTVPCLFGLEALVAEEMRRLQLQDVRAENGRVHCQGTMGDIARCSIGKPTDYHNEELLYKLFGINAELLIDHAWGWEPCTMADVKAYKPETNSTGSGL